MARHPRPEAVCDQPYTRPDGSVLLCTFPLGHDEDHSWFLIKRRDDIITPGEPTVMDVQGILSAIHCGNFDPYIEAILAVTHNRKRALRNVQGFPRHDPR